MAKLFSPAFNQQFIDRNGKPLAAGKLYTYRGGSTTPVYTYKNITDSARNTNPIILDEAGYADFVLEVGASYKFVLKDKDDTLIKTWDNVTAADVSSIIESLITDIEGKADRANPATNGHLAALDAQGNLKDSGHKPADFATKEQGEKADTAYQKPQTGIPSTDMTTYVQNLLALAGTAYQKPQTGIPKNDMSSGVQASLNKADTSYQKPVGGIPATDMATAVQNALNLALTAYQKPVGGIPSTDMTSAVQASLAKADTALQTKYIDTYNNSPKTKHVLLFTGDISSAAFASCIVKFENIYGNGNTGSSVSVLVSFSARESSAVHVDARIIANNNWDFANNSPVVAYYVDSQNSKCEVRIGLATFNETDFDNWNDFSYTYTYVTPMLGESNVTWNLSTHINGGRTGQVYVTAGNAIYGTLPRVDINLTSGTNNIYLDRNALFRLKCAAGSSVINLLSHNASPVHCPIQILKNNQCEVLTLNWYNDAGYSESSQVSFDTGTQAGYQGDIAYYDVNIWKDGANVIRRWMY